MNSKAVGTKLVIFMICTSMVTSVLATVVGNITFEPTATYSTVFENASGLEEGEEVKVAGVPVGKIKSVSLHNGSQAMVEFTIRRDQPVLANTRAIVRYKNLTGDRFLELKKGLGQATQVDEGATIPVTRTEGALDLDRLLNGFKPLFAGLDPDQTNRLARSLIKVLNGESATIGRLVDQIASLTNTLADRDKVIGQVIDNMNRVLATVDDNGKQLSELIVQLQRLISGLKKDRETILSSLQNINSVAGVAADVLNDSRPALAADIKQLDRLAGNLNEKRQTVDMVLRKLPDIYRLIGRGAYGNFFNFYLCGVTLKFSGPTGPVKTPEISSDVERCQYPR